MVEIIFSLQASQEFKKLPQDVQERIKEKLTKSSGAPFHYFERLKGRTDYKLRIGDYRVLADIDSAMKRIEVTKVGHRKNIYKQLS